MLAGVQLFIAIWSNQRPVFHAYFAMNLKRRISVGCLSVAAGLLLSACAGRLDHPPSMAATSVMPLDTEGLGIKNLFGFDVYSAGDKLHAAFIAMAPNKQTMIGYLYSGDGGLHWSSPKILSGQFNKPVESKAGNDIQIAASGEKLMMMWQVRGELPGMGPLFTAYSLDGGDTWQQGANPVGGDGDQSHHDLLADAEGRFHAVWLDDRDENGYQGLRYARSSDAGLHWESAQTLDDSSCSCCWNRLALSGDGNIDVLYRDKEFRDMALAQSEDGGANWQRLGEVGAFRWKFDGCPHNGGGLAYAGEGVLHGVVWTGAENKAGLYYLRSVDNGRNWMPPKLVDVKGFHADIAAIGGRLAMVWDARGSEGTQVFMSESSDNGDSWSTAKLLSAPDALAEFPRVVATPQGFLAMWSEKRTGTGRQWSATVFQ